MGRKRKSRLDLPERVYFKNGAYHYVYPTGKWEVLSKDYAEAMIKWAKIVNANVEGGQRTVGELLDRYLLEVVPKKAERTQKDNRQEVRWLRSFFGNMRLEAVSSADVAAYVQAREAKTRANREVALLSHAFNKAILWKLCKENPCTLPGLRNTEKARDRYVEDEEVAKFVKLAPNWIKLYVELRLQLALRQQDMLVLQWEKVTDEYLDVRTQKTGKRLRFAMTPELKDCLDKIEVKGDWVFMSRTGKPYTRGGFGTEWRKVMTKFVEQGGERFHEHDLRGKTATDIDDVVVAQKVLGHKSIKTTEIYIKARKRDVVQPVRRKKNGTPD